jgi:hypothetical protein
MVEDAYSWQVECNLKDLIICLTEDVYLKLAGLGDILKPSDANSIEILVKGK